MQNLTIKSDPEGSIKYSAEFEINENDFICAFNTFESYNNDGSTGLYRDS